MVNNTPEASSKEVEKKKQQKTTDARTWIRITATRQHLTCSTRDG